MCQVAASQGIANGWVARTARVLRRNAKLAVASCFPKYPGHTYVDSTEYTQVGPRGGKRKRESQESLVGLVPLRMRCVRVSACIKDNKNRRIK